MKASLPSSLLLSREQMLRGDIWSLSCRSVAESCPSLCDPVDGSPPGFPVLHRLLDFAVALLLVLLPKAHWTSHSRMSGSR